MSIMSIINKGIIGFAWVVGCLKDKIKQQKKDS